MKVPFRLAVLAILASSSLARADLIALYTFDNDANRGEDSSSNGNNIAGTEGPGGPVWGVTTGYNGSGGYLFGGDGDRLIAPIDVSVASMPQMTWGAWVRPDSIATGLRKIMGHDNGAWDRTIGLDDRQGAEPFRYTSFTGIGVPLVGLPAPVNTTDWTFIAAVYDETASSVTVYLDLDATTSADSLLSATGTANWAGNPAWPTFSIGSIRPDVNNEGWLGAIDNAFVFNEALDANKLAEIRRRGVPEILGIAEGDPEIDSNPATLFGDLTALGAGPGTVPQSVRIINKGLTQDLNITGIAINGPDRLRYQFAVPPNLFLTPGQTTDIEVTLTPTVAGGSFEATLIVISNDALTPSFEIPLDAIVTSDPNIELVRRDPLFGPMTVHVVPARIIRTFTIRNTGVANTLNLNPAPSITGFDALNYAITGPLSVAPGQEIELEVTLNPGGRAGIFSASLEINSNDADNPVITIPLDGDIITVPPASLLAFYPFDNEVAPLTDASGVTGDATIGGGGPIAEPLGGFEKGYYFFGGADRLTVPLNINPGVLPRITFGAWVRPSNLNAGLRKVIGHDDGAWDRTLGLDNRGGDFRYTAFTGTNNNLPLAGTPGPVNTEDWTFLAVTYDNLRADVTVYLDLDAATTGDALVKVSEPTLMGNGWDTVSIGSIRPDQPNEGWEGCIDNVFFYDGILTDAQLEDIRNRGRAAIIDGGEIRIIDITRNPNNTVTISWESDPAPGTTYKVLFSQDLSASIATWSDDDDMIPTGGAQTSHTTQAFGVDELWFVVEQN